MIQKIKKGEYVLRKPAVWKHYSKWTSQEKIYLLANASKMKVKHLSLQLGRSEVAVRHMYRDLKNVTDKQLRQYVDRSLKQKSYPQLE